MRTKESPRLTHAALAAEAASAGLRIVRVVPVLPVFSELWIVVMQLA
jgi:hypothetical protein